MPLYIYDAVATLLVFAFVFLAGVGIGGKVMRDSMCECAHGDSKDDARWRRSPATRLPRVPGANE